MSLESEIVPVSSYSDFINKLIRAGRNDGTKFYFKFGAEISPADFIEFANRFIEDYYASVPPEFAITNPMKFSFGAVTDDGRLCPVKWCRKPGEAGSVRLSKFC